jgi:NAD(P)H-hydrate repair Nnr-like enzyme with NAD(P)H-hydrate dehydratase domain
MANLLGIDKAEITRNPAVIARQAAAHFQAVVALKGATTLIAEPGGKLYCNQTGNVGLATSGSGDTLSGIVAGLAARGAPPGQAAAWAVYLHGSAGDKLAARFGPLGFLARELLAEIPGLMATLSPQD